MKKYILGLILCLISIVTFAHHFIPQGQCGPYAYFKMDRFPANSTFQFIISGAEDSTDILGTIITTGDHITSDSVFSLEVAPGTGIELRYRINGNKDFTWWHALTFASDSIYSGCGALPVSISNFRIQRRNNEVIASFNAGNETGVDHYNLLASKDQINWVVVTTIQATGAKSYSFNLTTGQKAAASLLGLFCFISIKKRKKWLSVLSMILIIGFYSCQKEVVQKHQDDYRYYRVQPVERSGRTSLSDVVVK